MQDQIKQLQSEFKKEKSKNEILSEELRSVKAHGGAGGSSSSSGNVEMVKKRSFDQLVKEADQCFAELNNLQFLLEIR